ncbi:MAG: response regulator receiver sensor signal transduction histidine kinase [Verrucomicrobia bacterium]|nr:response regulator receiver sensor signal transduction histidine kinase [Verrucomicrobiota bacterium]
MHLLPMIRVLYTDDDPQITEVVQTYFAHFAPECQMEFVTDGRSCLARMQRGGIDVLLLDLELPDINGLHILSELASRGDSTPVIMVSARGQTQLAVKALRAGAVDCIDKASPQFLELPALVKNVYARQQEKLKVQRPASLSVAKYRVLLIDSVETLQQTLAMFFSRNAPRLELTCISSIEKLEATLADRAGFDAVILGPSPGKPGPLDALRTLHTHSAQTPVILLAAQNDGATAVAAFKLGAQDYILQQEGYLSELVFSLNSLLRRSDTDRLNERLSRELAELNQSLEAKVASRTEELKKEVAVRQKAEIAAAEHAVRLQTLSKRLFKIQEDERRAIARELHDQVGQMLTGLKFQLEALVRVAGEESGAEVKEKLGEALGLAKDLMSHVRELTQQFRPRILDDLGLRAALEWHARLFQRQTGVNATVEVSLPDQRLPIELEVAVFRITQEALTNIARHAGCTEASVMVTHDAGSPGRPGGRLLVEISDRGRGFDLDAALASRNSIGLTSLTERVGLAGGTVEIFSRINQGTRIHAEFPLVEDTLTRTPAIETAAPAEVRS